MYVALTRARRRLYLTFAQSRMLHGQVNYNMMSSFLRELPDALLQWLSPRLTQRNPSSFGSYSSPAASAKLPPAPPAPAKEGAWRIGQRVFHQKFGEGTITGLEGNGTEGRVQVNFKHAGSKWLALEYAKLTAA